MTVIFQSGCAVAPIAVLAAGGFQQWNMMNPEQNIEITIDEQDHPIIKSQLKNVSHIGILAKGQGAIGFSDYWEQAGNRATVVNGIDPESVSLSQAKSELASTCRKGVHASAFSRLINTETNTMSAMLGKASIYMDVDLYIRNCKLGTTQLIPLSISFNAMGDNLQVDRALGAGIAAKFVEIRSL